ncbi:MAG: phage integrase SAM-like domain-containing protein [Clostridiales bacterium]|jgi:site-specific recombinase XerD|nr:phage integrase SAM-like domain-containing protein [Clostridiales bacterium]
MTFDHEEDYQEYEKKVEEIHKINNTYLSEFEEWLSNKGLSEKTIKNHVNNVDFYINYFLCYYDALDVTYGCYKISSFLGDWFIRKALWSSCAHIKSNAAGIKKFYGFMLEKGVIDQDDYENLKEDIKDEMPDWLEEMQSYDDRCYDW